MSTKENNEVAVEKVTENDKASADAKCDIKGIKRPVEEKNEESKKQKKEENGDGEIEEEIKEEMGKKRKEEVNGDGEYDGDDIPKGEEGEDEDAEGEVEGEIEDNEDDA